MYTIGVSGSPRVDANTSIMVKEVLENINCDSRFISLGGLDINPCMGCNLCWHEGKDCPLEDDLTWVIGEVKKADAIVLGSPNYFSNVSSQLKMLMDRLVVTDRSRSLRDKVLGVVVAQDAAGRGAGGDQVVSAIRGFYGGDLVYAGGVVGHGGPVKGNIRSDERAMRAARALAERMMELVRG